MNDQGTTPSNSVSAEVRVANELGLHARPAARLAQEAQRFESAIALVCGDQEVDAKSILDILTLAAPQGGRMTVRASGADAEQALASITRLFESRFVEE
ncbi:HPr family phosphocarrier protein [Desulfocurvus sp. DL9XJH121]